MRIDGSIVGFVAVALALVVMASTFGLLLAALGNTPRTTRGVASLATLVMVMLGFAAMFALVAVRRFRWEES